MQNNFVDLMKCLIFHLKLSQIVHHSANETTVHSTTYHLRQKWSLKYLNVIKKLLVYQRYQM